MCRSSPWLAGFQRGLSNASNKLPANGKSHDFRFHTPLSSPGTSDSRSVNMKIILPVRSILKPSSLSMVAVSLSLAAWLFPTFGVLKKGWENPSRLDTATVVILACWYLLIFTSFFLGEKIAGLWSLSHGYKPTSRLLDLESNVIYLGFTLIGALGLGAMVATIVRSMSLAQMILFISLGQSNALKQPVFEEYHVGIVSLRYVVLYPASVALYRMIRFREYSLLNLFNVLMLAVCTFVSF